MQLVAAKCPGCQTTLRIPADWLQDLVRCKRCGLMSMDTAPLAIVTDFEPVDEPTASADGTGNPGTRWKVVFVGIWLVGMMGLIATVVWSSLRSNPASPSQPVQMASAGPVATAPETPGPPATMPKVEAPPTSPENPRRPRNPMRPNATGPSPKLPVVPAANATFPRRALAISVNNYLYANPVHPGSPGREVLTILDYLFHALNIAPDQVVTLSDTGKKARPPWKPVIESTTARFLDSCRAQDRILVIFTGHVVELEERFYLMPIEGELGVKDSLIPLPWLLDRLGRCRACQKVLVLDVCRLDTARGAERPGTGAMSAKLALALENPPPGVQVWTACGEGQYSNEIQNGPVFGGAFLNQVYEALLRFKQIVPAAPRPQDSLPILPLANVVNKQVAEIVKKQTGLDQAPRLHGFEAENGALYNPDEPNPPPVAIELPPPPAEPAPADLIQGILADLDVPTIKMTKEWRVPLRVEGMPLFLAKDLAAYPADNAATLLRRTVLKARDVLNQTTDRQLTYQYFIVDRGRAILENAFKQRLVDEGKNVARILLPLTEALQELEAVGKTRDQEPRRWQANYDYMLARYLAQVAYIYEYQYQLGQMRKELPPRDPALHQGWQLTPQDKMTVSERDYKAMATQARKLLEGLIQNHPGTPWAVLAKRDLLTYIGLDWKAVPGPR